MDTTMLDKLSNSDVQALQEFALEILQQKVCSIPIQEENRRNQLLRIKFIKNSSDGISFKNHSALNLILAKAIVEKENLETLSATDKRNVIYSYHNKSFDFKPLCELSSYIILILVNYHSQKELLIQLLSEENIHKWWTFFDSVYSILPELKIDANTLGEIVTCSVERGDGDLAIGKLNVAIERFSSSNPLVAKCLLDRNQKEIMRTIANNMLVGISLSSKDELAYARTKWNEMQNNSDIAVKRFVPSTISALTVKRVITLDEGLKILNDFSHSDQPQLLSALIMAYGEIFKNRKSKRNLIINKLKSFLSLEDKDGFIKHSVSRVLLFDMKEISNDVVKKFHLYALPFFYEVHEEHEGTIKNIDMLIRSWAKLDPQVTINFLKNWAKNHPKGKPINHSSRYLSTINHLIQHNSIELEKATILWMLDDLKSIRLAASKAILADEFKIASFNDELTYPLRLHNFQFSTFLVF